MQSTARCSSTHCFRLYFTSLYSDSGEKLNSNSQTLTIPDANIAANHLFQNEAKILMGSITSNRGPQPIFQNR